MTESTLYTDKQKEELSKLFAEALHKALNLDGPHPTSVEKMAESLLAELRVLKWFGFEGNKYGVLRHLEEAGVYGAFGFLPDQRASLYLRAVFSIPFQDYVRQKRPSQAEFVARLSNQKLSGARKPTQEKMLGDATLSGNKRPNMRGMLGRR